ncbi:hypothetical protein GCM10018773_34790 [Streptomyces candidus]|nr:hypothetical protein GCM10018773_34790 [Streptomyces candidus]
MGQDRQRVVLLKQPPDETQSEEPGGTGEGDVHVRRSKIGGTGTGCPSRCPGAAQALPAVASADHKDNVGPVAWKRGHWWVRGSAPERVALAPAEVRAL